MALQKQLGEVKSPLTELRIRANGRKVIVERAGVHLEPISGQTVLNFETRELMDKIRVMPQHTADDWVALGVEREQYESEANLREASEAYQRALIWIPAMWMRSTIWACFPMSRAIWRTRRYSSGAQSGWSSTC